jgi:hypothetical protein
MPIVWIGPIFDPVALSANPAPTFRENFVNSGLVGAMEPFHPPNDVEAAQRNESRGATRAFFLLNRPFRQVISAVPDTKSPLRTHWRWAVRHWPGL